MQGLKLRFTSMLVILLQPQGINALQVLKDGQWLAVDPIPNAFVVNVGLLLQIISNKRLIGAEHRVVTNANTARTTVAYFPKSLDQNLSLILLHLPTFSSLSFLFPQNRTTDLQLGINLQVKFFTITKVLVHTLFDLQSKFPDSGCSSPSKNQAPWSKIRRREISTTNN
ncbi:hypothetical protein K1719_015966 [Acacia pycnantha]|nr:hypothetical protein K1719_015966 [Acacia pycnantha]